MSGDTRLTIEDIRRSFGISPTGPALLRLVSWAGARMLDEMKNGSYDEYQVRKTFYIELLQIAEKDAYCAPILVNAVQFVLDEEGRLFREGAFKRPRLDSSG